MTLLLEGFSVEFLGSSEHVVVREEEEKKVTMYMGNCRQGHAQVL
jgi:hypothetical protein